MTLLRAALGLISFPKILAHLPVDRRLHGVLDAQRAALDEEHVFVVRRRHSDARKCLHEFGEVRGVNIGVRRLVDRDGGELVAELRVVEPRMVVADRAGGEVREEIEDVASALRVEHPRAFRLFQVHDELVAVREHVAAEDVVLCSCRASIWARSVTELLGWRSASSRTPACHARRASSGCPAAWWTRPLIIRALA